MEQDPRNEYYRNSFEEKVETLKFNIAFNLQNEGVDDEDEALRRADCLVGSKKHVLIKKASDGVLDDLMKKQLKKMEDHAKQEIDQIFHHPTTPKNVSQNYHPEESSLKLLENIQKVPGSKIVTFNFNFQGQQRVNSFYVHEDGHVGDDKSEPDLTTILLSRLDYMMNAQTPSSIIIRQFIPNSAEAEIINGKSVSIPWKALYAVLIINGDVLPLSAEDVEQSMNVDAQTGRKLDPESRVIYKDFNEFMVLHPNKVPKLF